MTRNTFIRALKAIVDNVYLKLAVAAILLLTTSWDLLRDLDKDIASGHLRGMHGVFLFALMHLLTCLSNAIGAMEKVDAKKI
jgi:hypothetical protein